MKRSGAKVTLGHRLASLNQDSSGVDVELTDGSSDRYDLVIGADGVFSQVRQLVFPEAPAPSYTGQAVWRYNLPRPAEVDKLAMYAGPEARPAWCRSRRISCTCCTSRRPAGRFRHSWTPTSLATEFRRRLDGFGGKIAEVKDLITDSSKVVYRPIETVWVAPPWQRGRVALIGDAAARDLAARGPGRGDGARGFGRARRGARPE